MEYPVKTFREYAPWVEKHGLTAPYGECQCGCGKKTSVSPTSSSHHDRKAGHPLRFVKGHRYTPPPKERLYAKIKKNARTGCWEWQGAKTSAGYGLFSVDGSLVYTHRFSYNLHNGRLPDDLHVCHKCDNPSCCNPDHLFLGTDADNLADMRRKNRHSPPPKMTGRRNPSTKISEKDVLQIRKMKKAGKSLKEIAVSFSISKTNVADICKRKIWRHVR